MAQTAMQDFARYLLAKRSVDDRALNRRVWGRLERELRKSPAGSLRIVDVGAGLGTGAQRIAEWRLVEPLSAVRYTGVEPRKELLEEARRRLRSLPFPAELAAATLEEFAARDENRCQFDLVVAQALLDILELSPSLEALVGLARPGGLVYLPITFDGETIFEPAHEDDAAILSGYHASMGAIGDSKTGRKLVHALQEHPVDVVEMASSDWIVFPTAGSYPSDEAFFLKFVVGMVERTLGERAKRWAAARREQIDDGQLLYIAHQIDCLARKR